MILTKPTVARIRDQALPSSRHSSTERLAALPDTFSHSSLSANPNPNPTTTTTTTPELQKHYKKLAADYKLLLYKSSFSSKSNHIRLTLLKFLRLELGPDDAVASEGGVDDDAATSILAKYWSLLLSDLQNSWNKMVYVDRTCYLESVSRIMSRKEWRSDDKGVYSDLLIMTLHFIFTKLFNLKNLSLNLNAFIGKTFNFAFFHLPKFADILLFTLFVKNHSINSFLMTNDLISTPVPTAHFPLHLRKFINYRGDYAHLLHDDPSSKLLSMNCMNAPKTLNFYTENDEYDEVLEVDLKVTNWVKRWASYDSDIFRSFLKHYLETCLGYNQSNSSHLQFTMSNPAGIVIYCHLYEILNSNISMLRKSRTIHFNDSSTEVIAFFNTHNIVSKNGKLNNYQLILQNSSFLKLLKVMQTLVHDFKSTPRTNKTIIGLFESLLLRKAGSTMPYNAITCEIIYDLVLQLSLYVNDPNDYGHRSLTQLNWKFWISGLIRMLSTDNMFCQTKSLSALFNLWDLIPLEYNIGRQNDDSEEEELKEDWIKNDRASLIYNLSQYLISKPIWESFFVHWQPLIRHLYHRLITFKIVGSKTLKFESGRNFASGGSFLNEYRKIVRENLSLTYKKFKDHLDSSDPNSSILQFELLPSNPILNKKLVITSASSFGNELSSNSIINILDPSAPVSKSSSSSTIVIPQSKKIYAFEIFDDAIYSSSLGSITPFGSKTSFPTSVSKTPTGSPQISPSISRSSSSSTLNKVPILGTALSFFKKVGSPNNSTSCTSKSPSPSINQSLRVPNNSSMTSLNSNRTSPIARQQHTLGDSFALLPSSPSPSISDDDSKKSSSSSLYQQQQVSEKVSSTSLSSLASSLGNIGIMSGSQVSTNPNSMDSIPMPPELLVKIPEPRSFRYRYQLTSTNESFQRLQAKVIEAYSKHSISTQSHSNLLPTPPSSSESVRNFVKPKKFFQFEEILTPHSNIPGKPKLPFDELNKYGTNGIGLIITDEDEDDSASDSGSESMIADTLSNFLEIGSPRTSTQLDTFLGLNNTKDTKKSTDLKRNDEMFASVKHFNDLGKALNEWDLVVDEYEKYIKFINDEIFENGCLDTERWFVDPLLVCDV